MDVAPRVTTNDMATMIRLACAGAGITFGMAETFAPFIARRELVPILDEYAAPFAGFYLYYPKRAHPPARLRALIDYLKKRR